MKRKLYLCPRCRTICLERSTGYDPHAAHKLPLWGCHHCSFVARSETVPRTFEAR